MKAKGMKLAYAYEGDCVHNSGIYFFFIYFVSVSTSFSARLHDEYRNKNPK